ncbi:MAG: arsenate reductase ArsC [Bdellovibrionales bacterium]|nr:arsenate reductase ArsC [Bdellovibrionales bacterium]
MKILFMCVANSIRSQLAEAIARHTFGNRVDVRSAGSNPSGRVHPVVLQVLREIGVPTTGLASKGIDAVEPEFIQELDFVITLCQEEVCPILPGDAQKIDWATPDPSGLKDQLMGFRNTRDYIKKKIDLFNTALLRCEAEEEIPADI